MTPSQRMTLPTCRKRPVIQRAYDIKACGECNFVMRLIRERRDIRNTVAITSQLLRIRHAQQVRG
jgi:hypothetical protein